MTREEFIETYNRCWKKTFYFFSWKLTEDPDEDVAIYVDKEGTIFIEDIKTPYSVEQVTRIKYRNYEDENPRDEHHRIRIFFCNGDFLEMSSDYFDNDEIWLHREGANMLSEKELYEYWKNLLNECEENTEELTNIKDENKGMLKK